LRLRLTGIGTRIWEAAGAAVAASTIAAGLAVGAEDIAVEAQLHDHALVISAHATVHASLPLIWRTLTDYDHLAGFIPGMKSSRVLERRGNTVTVEQSGEARFWIFRYPIAVVVQSDEHYPATLGVKVLSGNLRRLAGAYRIEAVSGATDRFVLQWQGIIEPDMPLPLFITAPGMRETIAEQFAGLVDEIERRGALQANRQ
jgi:hypothetical protein